MTVRILECRRFSGLYSKTGRRIAKDYEIDLEVGEPRTAILDGIAYPIQRGNIRICRPGQMIDGRGFQHSILLTLDFSGAQPSGSYSRNIRGPQQPHCDSPLLENLNGVIVPFSENTFIPIYNELLNVAFTDAEAAECLVMELLHKLNAELYRRQYHRQKPEETACSKVLHYLKENIAKNITLEFLADMVHLDKSYLVRLFRNTYGKTPIRMLIQLRMEHASDLVTGTDMPIADIAAACGYSAASYFTAEYKKHFGTTPMLHRAEKP